MLKTSGSTESLIRLRKGGIKVGVDNKAGRDENELIKVKLITMKLIAVKLEMMGLEKKFKNRPSPKS